MLLTDSCHNPKNEEVLLHNAAPQTTACSGGAKRLSNAYCSAAPLNPAVRHLTPTRRRRIRLHQNEERCHRLRQEPTFSIRTLKTESPANIPNLISVLAILIWIGKYAVVRKAAIPECRLCRRAACAQAFLVAMTTPSVYV